MDSVFDRIALYLWRDRGGYDPETSGMTEDYNLSLWSHFGYWRYQQRGWAGRNAPSIIAFLGVLATIGAVFLTKYLDWPKADQQVKPNAGELLLSCTKEAGDVLRCRPVSGGENQVVTRAHSNGSHRYGTGPE